MDRLGRQTYGLYAVSPLQRAIIPVWQKRIIQAIDGMWRWANVPREHHKLNADMFSLDKWPGLPIEEAIEKAKALAQSTVNEYTAGIESKVPDQGYVTLGTVDILPIEHSSTSYMQPNELLNQISDQIWGAVNIPKSVVMGTSDSSFASEVLISNYTSIKILQIAEKVGWMILENTKKRLRSIDSSYPIEFLDIKLDFTLAATEIDQIKKMSAMAVSGIYTYDECRDVTKHQSLEPEQYNKLVKSGSTLNESGEYESDEPDPSYPETSHTRNSRPTGAGMSKAEKSVSSK
jgi:hypothetical protein